MVDEQAATLVFRDQAGEYYLLSQATLEQGRVPAEQKAEIERIVGEVASDDVAGHNPFLVGVFVGAILGGGTAVSTIVYEQSQGTLKGLPEGMKGKGGGPRT